MNALQALKQKIGLVMTGDRKAPLISLASALYAISVNGAFQLFFRNRQSKSRRAVTVRTREHGETAIAGSRCRIEHPPELLSIQ